MATIETTPVRMIAAATLVLVMQGCASISKNECVTADWYAVGYESAILGQREAKIGDYRKACAEHGVTPDLARYLEGREAGLQRFCEPRNGYRLGRNGTGYAGVCPQQLEGEFVRAYGAGRELYDTQQRINRLGRRISDKQSELKSLNEDVADNQAELIATGTTPPRRVLLLKELLELQNRVQSVERDIHDARADRDHARARLAHLERRSSAW